MRGAPTTHTPGLSALQLQRQLGIDSYETAWAILHKLRRAMVRPDRERLKEKVEVDEAYIGGLETGLKGGRQLLEKALIVAAVEIRGKASGRVRLQVVPDASAPSLTGFVAANVEPAATVLTDGWGAYAPLRRMGYWAAKGGAYNRREAGAMTITVAAVYEDGVLKPEAPLNLKDKSKVMVTIEASQETKADDDDPTGWKTADQLIGFIKDGPKGPTGRDHDKYLYGAE